MVRTVLTTTCFNGLIPTDVVLASRSSDALGGNLGGGMTIPLGKGRQISTSKCGTTQLIEA
jgi:hypothetical protein